MKKREITLLTDFIIQDLTAAELEKRYEMSKLLDLMMICKAGGGCARCPDLVCDHTCPYVPPCDSKIGGCFAAIN